MLTNLDFWRNVLPKVLYFMNKLLVKILAFGVAFSAVASASIVDSELRQWKGKWIVRADSLVPEYKVAHLRRTFELKEKPESFRVKVSADNRFVLYVNGKIAGDRKSVV